jgi:[ribosomal protein S18]-alanine N-acetyltransferase
MVIRPATRRDVPAIWRIETEQFPEPWTKQMLVDEICRLENRRYSVAVVDGQLLGYLGAMFVDTEMHVNTLAVRKHAEGRGIATALLTDLWLAARERGVAKATLEVAVSNERAQALYRRFGFAPVGVRRNYYAKAGEDALVCWADLASAQTVTP